MFSTLANKLATGATMLLFSLALVPTDAFAFASDAPPESEVAGATSAPPMPVPAPAPALTPAPNDLPDASWAGLVGVQVNVQRTDGIFVYGQLLGFDATSVTILGSDNLARTVPRQQVYAVQLLQPAATTTKPGKPPILDPQRHATGNALVLGGGVTLGVGAIAFFTGMGVALGEWDAAYLLYITLPGALAMVAIGMPLMIAGAGLKREARQPALVLRDRSGTTRLELRPGVGLRF